MCRVGFDKCVGFLKGGFNTWKNDGNEVSIAGNIKVEAFEEIMNNKPADAYFLDVRDINEKEKGFVTKFDNMVGMWSMEKLFKAGENVLDKNNTIYCMC